MGIRTLFVVLMFFLSSFVSSNYQKIKGTEGFWRVAQDQNNIWWFLTPENSPEFMTMVTSVNPESPSKEPNSLHYISTDKENWPEKTASKIKKYGFKAAGAWSNRELSPYISYTLDLNILKHLLIPIDSEEWSLAVDKKIKELVEPLKNDKNLIGYYLDNELDWNFYEPFAEKYFDTIYHSIKKYDPNHLVLGVRFNNRPPLKVLEACSGKTDVNSINIYPRDGKIWKNNCREMYEITGCPIIISEFSFYADDNRSGNKNDRFGPDVFPSKVKNQQTRGEMYQFFVEGLASTSFIVGAEWFQYMDEPPLGRPDGENYNFGIVDIFDQPYQELIDKIITTSNKVNKIHEKSDLKQLNKIWIDDPQRINYAP